MFLVNSCLGLFSAASFEAPLIPKLRGQLAEFLNNPSPVGLRILSSSTCVGLRYGHLSIPHTFSRHRASRTSLLDFGPLRPGQPTPGSRYLHVSVCLRFGGYGISTVCASTTPSGLALAPGLPWADEPSPGNLRFSAIMIPCIDYASRPRLSSRLTLGGRTFPKKP